MTSSLAFLTQGGEMGRLMSVYDWSRSSITSPDKWPQSLRSVVGLILSSKFPMFIAWGPELAFLYNDGYKEILGKKHPTALGHRFRDIWSEIWGDICPIVEKTMLGCASYHENLPLSTNRHGFDEQAWFTFSYSPIFDELDKVAGMFCVVTETTEQVLAGRHRAEENERLRALFQQAPGIIAILRGPNHIFDIANDAYVRLVGRRGLIGKSLKDALPEVVDQGYVEILDRVFATGEPFVGKEFSVLLRRHEDETLEQRFVNFIYQPTFDYRGEINGIFVEGSDVTESVRAFQIIQGSEERLLQLANTIPHLAWMANPDGWIHWYNDRWYEYTGKTFEDMEGWGWRSVHHPDTLNAVEQLWAASIASGQPFELSFPLAAANGTYRTFFTRVVPLHDAGGEITQWFGTNTDVTDIENAQNELREANRRKDEFLAMLAHELRNPLAPIATAAGLLKLTPLDTERVQKTSDVISRQTQHMSKLLDDLLDVSRVTRGVVTLQSGTCGLNDLLVEAIEQVQALIDTKDHNFTFDRPAEKIQVIGDRTRLVQVFSNILNNAAKYTNRGGNIRMLLRLEGTQAVVSVEDDGPGIASSLLPHIFDLFTQAERAPGRTQGGLGLGLALVKNLVQLHGGTVTAHSAGPGSGSRFEVRLPQSAETSCSPIQMPSPSNSIKMSTPTRILVVDDNQDAAELLMHLLRGEGHHASVAHSACEALEVTALILPRVIFLDIGLPDMDGYELARKIRAIPEMATARIVAVTGYGQPQDKVLATAAGFDHHLVKPAEIKDVLRLLGD